jgi:hypothetical protein
MLSLFSLILSFHASAFAGERAKELSICSTPSSIRIQMKTYEPDIGYGIVGLLVRNPANRYLAPNVVGSIGIETGMLPETMSGLMEFVWTPIETELKTGKSAPALLEDGRYQLLLAPGASRDSVAMLGMIDLGARTFTAPDGKQALIEKCQKSVSDGN